MGADTEESERNHVVLLRYALIDMPACAMVPEAMIYPEVMFLMSGWNWPVSARFSADALSPT